jgi:hypothetical protein
MTKKVRPLALYLCCAATNMSSGETIRCSARIIPRAFADASFPASLAFQVESPSVFSSISRSSTSDSSGSACSGAGLQKKATLEYGDITTRTTSPSAGRSINNAGIATPHDLSDPSPSKRIRRTQSATVPYHEPPSVAENKFTSFSQPLLSSPVDVDSSTRIRPHVISHFRHVQSEMDRRGIAWGVQFEIARGVNMGEWQWEDVTGSKLDQLKGCNAEAAPKVAAVMLGHDYKPPRDLSVW